MEKIMIIHYLLAIICSLCTILLLITDYKRQKEENPDKEEEMEIRENNLTFYILILLTISLFF